MPWILTAAGGAILVILLLDVLWTTMGLGGGILTRRMAALIYPVLMKVQRVDRSRLLLSWIAIVLLMSFVITWMILLWVGWTLVFSAHYQSVVQSHTHVPVGFWDRVYFTGFTIFTLGIGDLIPNGAVYRVLTAVASLSGFFTITFGVTYLVPVVQAATLKRKMGATIASLGLNPAEILTRTCSAQDCGHFSQHLLSLMSDLSLLEQQHLTYPMLHYFHGRKRSESLALGIAAIDEALTVLRYGLVKVEMPDGIYTPVRRVITQFLSTLKRTFLNPEKEEPPYPSLAPYRFRGFHTVSDAEFARRLADLSERRRLLLALVRNEAWDWNLLTGDVPAHTPEEPLD